MADTPQSRGGNDFAGKRILVVENEFLIAIDIQRILEGAGAEVAAASRVQQAIELLATAPAFDAAVLDLKLERETSVPIAEQLHATGVPFVFLTGAPGDAEMAHRFKDAPIVGKPFDSRALFAAIKTAMAAKR